MNVMDYFRRTAKINNTYTTYMRLTCVLYTTITSVLSILWLYLTTLPAALPTGGGYLHYSIMCCWAERAICIRLICGETVLYKRRGIPSYLVAVSSKSYRQTLGEAKFMMFIGYSGSTSILKND